MTATPEPRPTSDGVPHAIDDEKSVAIAIQLPPQLATYARSGVRWRPGCEVTVLRDGHETFGSMLATIGAARSSICFETYILAADATGERFKAALIEKARAGVTVRLLYDAVGSFGLSDAWLDELRAAGAEVIDFNPIALWRLRFNLSHRDHRKILVVDNSIAFTGGLNLSDDYATVADGGVGWHDMHCRVRGPIVLDLARLFRRTWLRARGTRYPAPPRANDAMGVGGTAFVRLLENTKRRQRTTIRRAYMHVIKAARESVLIQNAYFLPDRGLRRVLARAVRRGVKVSVIVPGHSDVKLVEWASLYVLRRLARRGVEILRWRGPMMHAKTAVVDALWSTIGTYNFDAQSRFNNLECTVEILDGQVGETLVAEYDGDRPNCEPYDESTWRALPWWKRAFAWIAYRLRRFL
jgi:cardiolipin synthase